MAFDQYLNQSYLVDTNLFSPSLNNSFSPDLGALPDHCCIYCQLASRRNELYCPVQSSYLLIDALLCGFNGLL